MNNLRYFVIYYQVNIVQTCNVFDKLRLDNQPNRKKKTETEKAIDKSSLFIRLSQLDIYFGQLLFYFKSSFKFIYSIREEEKTFNDVKQK